MEKFFSKKFPRDCNFLSFCTLACDGKNEITDLFSTLGVANLNLRMRYFTAGSFFSVLQTQ